MHIIGKLFHHHHWQSLTIAGDLSPMVVLSMGLKVADETNLGSTGSVATRACASMQGG